MSVYKQLNIFDFLDEQNERADIKPIKNLNSGISYKGSKRKISHLILQEIRNNAPHAKHFYDMFGGGGAIALNAPPHESVIYCDIPYRNTSGYKLCGNAFDYERFYRWSIDKAKQGYNVFISEYSMPQDRFREIWHKDTYASFNVIKSECGAKNKPQRTERLFTPKV